ncbi:MAG: OmpA family protein [Bacteroidales bacterium]|nr:OmpA family protein [Bacteroidales bacterium]MBN2818471.1 OmpA family protein [Bacteroidales bacterium]
MKILYLIFTLIGILFVSNTIYSQENNSVQLVSFSNYDFVPGDQVLFYEDFSQDNIGDLPMLWVSNGSGEVKTLNIAEGKWFHMNGEDAVYCYTKSIEFPANFIMEFDFIPDADYADGSILTFYQETENRELNDELFPGTKGLHVIIGSESWETRGYDNENDEWLEGLGKKATVDRENVNHIIIWVQNRRVRIYHKGEKVVDMGTNIIAGTKFNRFRFSGWDRASLPFISNIKITSASPDTRSKLLTEGKLISYGIYFDSGKDEVKPESYGSIKEIANVLKENPGLKIEITGHTDSDGNDAANLDLSKRRADSVKNYLVSQFQIDASRMQTDGKGETIPIENNATPQGKAKNRRVEFVKL